MDTGGLNDIRIHQDSDTDETPLERVNVSEARKAEERSRDDKGKDSEDSFKVLANVQKTKKSNTKASSKVSEPVIVKSERRRRHNSTSSVSRRSGSTSDSNKSRKRHKKLTPEEENRDKDMREKKLDILRKIERLCYLNKHQMRTDAINYTYEEIENEYKKESLEYRNRQGTEMYKGLLKMSTTGFEMANTHLNPYADVMDLVGWSTSVKNDVDAEQYDEVLSQLYEKYGTSVEWGPEWKLGFMLMQSAVVYAGTKHMTQNPSVFQGILGNIMGMPSKPSKFPQPPPQQPQKQSPKTQYQQQYQQPPQQQYRPQPPQQQREAQRDDSDTSDDMAPSKMNEIDYTDILQKMRSNNPPAQPPQQSQQQSQPQYLEIPKKRMGRPPKKIDGVEVPKRRAGRPRKNPPVI
jgi:Family of unknown function (DUF5767)